MAIYSFKTPDGKIHDLEAPEGTDPRKVMAVLEQRLSSESAFRPRPASKKLGGFKDLFFESAQTLGLADEAAAFAANPNEENRKALLAAGESKFRTVGFGEGENWAAFKQLLGGSLGQMVAPVAAATAGSFATPIAGVAAGFGASAAQYEAQNLLRQAQEQERAIAEGRTPEEVNLGKSLVASAGQAGLDVVQAGVFAKLFRALPFTRNLLLPEKEAAQEAVDKIVRSAEAGTLKYRNGIASGAVKGVAFEVPQEVAQTVLERWQANLSLTDDEAQGEYTQAAIGAAILGPLLGGAAGAAGTARERGIAETEQARRGTEAGRREAPPETREEVGTTEEAPPETREEVGTTEEAPPETREEVGTTEEAPPPEQPVVEEEVERPPVTPFAERPEQETMFREEAPAPVVEEEVEAAAPVVEAPAPVVEEEVEAAAPTPAPDLRNLALEVIKTTPTIKAISEATGLNQPKAAAIMRGFVDEGLVERKGNKFKLIEAAKPEEVAAAPAAAPAPSKSGAFAFEPEKLEALRVPEYKSREKLIELPIDDFLAMAKPGRMEAKEAKTSKLLKEGTKFSSIPFLMAYMGKDGALKVQGHEGRHRALALKEAGYETMPIILRTDIRWSEQTDPKKFDYQAEWPTAIVSEDGTKTIPMPVSRDQALAPYPAPPTTPPEAPRGTEPVTSETVGGAGAGSTELPVSRAPAEGRGPAGIGTEGLGVPSAPAARVDEREEGVEPALTAATPPAAPPPRGPAPPGPPSGPSGAAPTPPTPPQRPTTPRQVKQAVQTALNSVTQSLMDRPNYSGSLAKKIIDALGNVPLNLRKAQFAIYSMPQMQQLLSTVLPYIRVLEKTNGLRAAQTSSALNKIAKNQARWQEIIKRHPKAKWEKLKKVATLGTLYQVDPTSAVVKQLHNLVRSGRKNPASLTPVEQVQYEIAAMYYSLPSDLRSILISEDGKSGIVPEYRKYRQQKFDAMVKNWTEQGMPSSVIEKLRREFNDPKNNLSFYIPLRRDQGVYRLVYVDTNGNKVSKIFTNPIERSAFRQQIEAQGVDKKYIRETSRYTDISGEYGDKPPTGFLGEIVELLKTSIPDGVDPTTNKPIENTAKSGLISEVYDIFLDYMPQNTLRQELSSRQVINLEAGLKQFGVYGFNEDFLETYAEEAPRIVYQLNNLRWVLPIEAVMKKLADQRDEYINKHGNPDFMQGKLDIPPQQLNEAFDSIRKRIDFGYSPTYAPWVYNIATTNYIFSIAANVSSALINTTTIPMLTIPVLAAKYGVMPTLRAINRASAMFAKAPTEGGIKIGGKRIGDWSASHGATGEYKQFFKALVDRGVIGAAAEQELLQAQRIQLSGYDSLGDKANYLAGYVFKNSERFNRETTLLASFMLAREKGKNFNDALEEAISNNNDVNGAVLPASDSRLYQTNLGRVLLTFRKYILNAAILIAGTFKEALARIEPDNQQQKLLRTVARRRLLGIYAGTYMVAGIGGMPLFGAAEMLAALMMGDDDEPYDLQQEVMESLGELGLNGPVNALIGLDVASRTGFTDVLWRDDPKRLAEVGYITFGLEKLAGPTYSTLMNWQRGFGLMAEGEIWRGTEAILPAAARNALKATRYATEGALTKNGVPIEEDIGAWNNTMQIFGFAPADLVTTQARVGAEYQTSQKLRQRRTALLTQLYAAVSANNGDAVDEALDSIAAFSDANPTIAIDSETVERSFRERDRRNAESIDGLYLEKNLRQATIPYVSPRD